LQFSLPPRRIGRVDSPLAILYYEDLIPGTQLLHKLEDLRYRVQTAGSPEELLETCGQAGPMFIFLDLVSKRVDTSQLVRQLRQGQATAHIPIIAFADESEAELRSRAEEAGATLVVTDAALLPHLGQFIEQALQVE